MIEIAGDKEKAAMARVVLRVLCIMFSVFCCFSFVFDYNLDSDAAFIMQ